MRTIRIRRAVKLKISPSEKSHFGGGDVYNFQKGRSVVGFAHVEPIKRTLFIVNTEVNKPLKTREWLHIFRQFKREYPTMDQIGGMRVTGRAVKERSGRAKWTVQRLPKASTTVAKIRIKGKR